MFQPVTLMTARLRLRALRQEDAPAFFAVWSDPDAMRYFSFPPMQSLEQAQARIASKLQSQQDGQSLTCVIEVRSSQEVIGDCCLFDCRADQQRAEVGFCLNRRHWGYGYMNEAASVLIDYGFQQVGLRRLEADVDPNNLASIRLLERLGFQREGYLRERWMIAGETMDSLLYGLLRHERTG